MSHQIPDWPVLTRHDARHLRRVALPLGGIGTGTISLGGRGDLRDWEVVNRPAKGYTPQRAGFVIRTESAGVVTTRALEGPIDPADYEGAHGSPVPNHSLPRFRGVGFEAAYPLGQVSLEDPDVPVAVRLQAFNPMVPVDAEVSGIPVAILRYVLVNRTATPVRATVCGTLPNFVGTDGSSGQCSGGRNEVRDSAALAGLLCVSDGVDPSAEQWGTMALSVLTERGDEVSRRTAWADAQWGNSLLDFWDDLTSDGRLDERHGDDPSPTASLAVTREIPAGGTRAVTFLVTWCFPNRRAWGVRDDGDPSAMDDGGAIVGNHYATRWSDAWQVATDVANRLPELEDATVGFVRAVCASDLPPVVLEAALYNLSTLRTQTCFRTADGRFFGWEGCSDRIGSCMGSCTHVWNYEPATAHLYGSLARSMREIEFKHATDERGLMSFRVQLPLADHARDWRLAAADGQMGCLIKLYREWRLSGDDEFLADLWPHARRALEFCWIPGGWDADRDGVMEGCQHNTMDVEYFGPNPQMACWYLGALRACEEMARHLGESGFADECRRLFDQGSRWVDANLFNGRWYEQHILPASDAGAIAEGLRHDSIGARDVTAPDLQLGSGCLTDQLVGDTAAELYGLGALLSGDHLGAALDSIMRFNRRDSVAAHFNHMRSYVLGDEAGLLMCTYPDGRRPERPFPYANEVMTGCEYTAAVGMIQHGRTEQALRVIGSIRERFDGWRRNPFDEAECGHHYVRAMASWGALLALTGFAYEARTGVMRLRAARDARWFWSTGEAWGTSHQRHDEANGGFAVDIEVLGGSVRLREVELTGLGTCRIAGGPVRLVAGDRASATSGDTEPAR